MSRAGHVVVGPAQHGVVLFATDLARQVGGPVLAAEDPRKLLIDDGSTGLRDLARAVDVVHLQFTDALYGGDCREAAATFAELAAAIPAPVTVTLHDLPDPADEPGRYERRSAAYRAVAGAVDGVVVSSRHEARLLGLLDAPGDGAWVIELPVAPGPTVTTPVPPGTDPEIGVLGFVHPGKGHAEALAELACLGTGLRFTAIGRAADGHADLVDGLRDRATTGGHRWTITGFVDETDLADRLHRVDVPLAPNRMVSASASINSWLTHGRRPLVLDGPYAREIAERRPEAIRLYREGELVAAVRSALAEPASTWLRPGTDIGPDRAETGRSYREFFRGVGSR